MQFELLVPLGLGLAAYLTHGLDAKGALAGTIMGYTLIFSQGFNWFLALLMFFGLSTLATSYKSREMKEKNLSQSRRTVENVLANGFVPLAAAVYGNPFAFMGALATATADTLSSEVGVLSKNVPRNILTGKLMKHGENGGVSLLGNTMMVLGSLVIAGLALVLFDDTRLFFITLIAGIVGCTADSIMGITLENKGVIGNGGVNFLATFCGAVTAIAISLL